jgi:hypothetical protein
MLSPAAQVMGGNAQGGPRQHGELPLVWLFQTQEPGALTALNFFDVKWCGIGTGS